MLEGVTTGLRMLCWPLHAEQKMNKLFMVEEMGVAAEMVGWQRGLVVAAEVEGKMRMVMETEEGRELRARASAHKEAAAAAWDDLYYLERACEAQRLAMATCRPLKAVPEAVAARTAAQMRDGDGESARLHLESVKRILEASEPDFRT